MVSTRTARPGSGINLVLLVMALAGTAFGVYGMLFSGDPSLGEAPLPLAGGAIEDSDKNHRRDSGETGRVPRHDAGGPSIAGDERKESPGTRPGPSGVSDPPAVMSSGGSSAPVIGDIPGLLQGLVQPPDPSDCGDAVIRGRIVDEKGAALAGVKVTARRMGLNIDGPRVQPDHDRMAHDFADYIRDVTRQTRAVQSAIDGSFSFSGLDATLSYSLFASIDEVGHVSRPNVAAGDDVLLVLPRNRLDLLGRLVVKEGAAPTRFFVSAVAVVTRQSVSKSVASEDGTFTLEVPAADTWTVTVTADGYYQPEGMDVRVEPGASSVTDIPLENACVVEGQVSDTAGAHLGGISVSLNSAAGASASRMPEERSRPAQSVLSVQTDSLGRYRFTSVIPGAYKLVAALGGRKAERDIEAAAGIQTYDLTIDVGALIVLKARNAAGEPVSNAYARFRLADGNESRGSELASNEAGVRRFGGIEPGAYTMTVSAPPYVDERRDVVLRAGENPVEVTLRRGAMLRGRAESSNGALLTNMNLGMRRDTDAPSDNWEQGRYSHLASGRYSVGPLEPGRWIAEFKVYRGRAYRTVHAFDIVLEEGDNTRDFVVPDGASLVAKVVDEQGEAVRSVSVELLDEKGQQISSSYTDGEGLATFSWLEPGKYVLKANRRHGENRGNSDPLDVIVTGGESRQTLTLHTPNCLRLTMVAEGSNAERAGMKVGDLLLRYSGTAVTKLQDLAQLIEGTSGAAAVAVEFVHDGRVVTASIPGGQKLGVNAEEGYWGR